MVEPRDLKQLSHQPGETADPHLSAPIAQLLRDSDDRTKAHAAYVRETAQVQNQTRNPLCDAGVALGFKCRGALRIHSAGYTQHDLVSNQRSFDGHNRQKSAPHYYQRQSFFLCCQPNVCPREVHADFYL